MFRSWNNRDQEGIHANLQRSYKTIKELDFVRVTIANKISRRIRFELYKIEYQGN
jgi:hypothetical protein